MGEWTVVASAKRAVRGLFKEETDDSGEPRFCDTGAEGSSIEPIKMQNKRPALDSDFQL